MDLSDACYPRTVAEDKLGVRPGKLTLDELAQRLSRLNTEEPVSVRDHIIRPCPFSSVYFRGEKQPWKSHMQKGVNHD